MTGLPQKALSLLACVTLVWGAGAGFAEAKTGFNEPRQITTNPGEDFAPSVSADGKTLVYVSDQSGNLDVWVKRLGPGLQSPDQRLTFHSGEDNSPAISPDGKWVVFVSHRTDPKGDLYLVPVLEGEEGSNRKGNKEGDEPGIEALTDASYSERDPVWSPDQKFIYYTSQDSNSRELSIFRLDPKSKKRKKVSDIPGVNPTVSGDGKTLVFVGRGEKPGLWAQDLTNGSRVRLTEGEFMDVSPRISGDGKRVYFTRYQDDTNQDGRITIDDRPNLWSVEFDGKAPGLKRQLTDSSTYDLQPVSVGDRVYFTSSRTGGTDVWDLEPDGLLPREDRFGNELQLVEDLCSDYSENVYRCLLADNALVHDFHGEQSLARILFRQARGYQALGNQEEAAEIYQRIAGEYKTNERYAGLSRIELILIEVARSREAGQAAYARRNKEALEQLETLIQENEKNHGVVARAWLEKGHVHFALDNGQEALKDYGYVIKTFPAQRPIAAEAAFSKSKVYGTVGDQKSVINAFVQVVRDYYDVESWTRRAISEILDIYEQQPTLAKKISNLQALVEQYQNLPILAAAVQNRIGELNYQAGENLLAREAYQKTIKGYPDAPQEQNAAHFALASIYAEEENFEMSLVQYQAITESANNLDKAVREARRGYIRKSIDKGDWELRVGEIKLARKSFLRLIDYEPATVEAHRGYVQAEATLKRIQEAIRFYQDRLKDKSQKPEDQYAFGLAHTYLDPPDLDTAQEWIQKALMQNSNNVFFHQTMGWIFEQREIADDTAGHLEQAVQEYQMALVLNDPGQDPQNEANLMLNLGNAQYSLANYFSSYLFYEQRQASGLPFLNPQREALYYQRFGEVAFKTHHPDQAVKWFKKSLEMVEKMDQPARMAELNDRIALAYQDAGQYAEAVAYFSRTLELQEKTGNQVSMARALRNIANNLYSLNEKEKNNSSALNQALGHYFDAIDKLQQFGVVKRGKQKKTTGGLVDVSIEAGVDPESSQAAMGFDKTGEEKLIFHYVGKIFGDFGDYDQAIDYFTRKLDLIPKDLDPTKHIPLLLEKALLLNQIGHFHFRSGRLNESKKFFNESYAISKGINNRQGVGVNASNLGRILILQCRTLPITGLKGEIETTLALLQEAGQLLDAEADSLPSPEFRVYVKNDLGILFHYLAFHFPESPGSKEGDLSGQVRASLERISKVSEYATLSRVSFEEAEKAAQSLPGDAGPRLATALRQNLDLTRFLTGRPETEADEVPAASPTLLFSEWQLLFLKSLQAEGAARQELLVKAADSLSRLPFGYSRGPAHLSMIEDLYHQLTQAFFDQGEFSEALHYSEEGLSQALVSRWGEQKLSFEDETRSALFDEVKNFTRDLQDLVSSNKKNKEEVSEEVELLLTGYQDFLEGVVVEEDPDLFNLISPRIQEVGQVQELLREQTVLLKYEWVGDSILVWEVTPDGVLGGRIAASSDLQKRLERIGRNGETANAEDVEALSKTLIQPAAEVLARSSSVILIASGPLEFLPWAALKVDGEPLIQKTSLAYQASLQHFLMAERGKNLYNSRILAVELPEESFGGLQSKFASAENLIGHDGNVDRFSNVVRHFGVVTVDSPAYLAGLDIGHSYISLTRRVRHFERMNLSQLMASRMDSNFFQLSEVDHRFSPETSVSPSAPLVQGLSLAGYPGVLLHRGAVDPELHGEFTRLFYASFRKGNPAASLQQVQVEMARKYPDSVAWAEYRYYGFPGMTDEEKHEFAQSRYQENVSVGAEGFKGKDYLAAIDRFEKALILLDFLEDQSQRAQLNKLLAQSAYFLQDYKKSIRYQKQVLAQAQKIEDPEQEAEAHYFLGILYSRDEDFKPSVEHLQLALKFYEEYEMLDKLAESYSTLGIIEENALDYDGALKAFSRSIRLNEEIGEDLNKGKELRRLGRIYYLRLNDYARAEEYFGNAARLFEELGNAEQTAEALMELGLVAEKQSKFEDAMAYYGKAQGLAEENELYLQLSKAFLYQGNTQWFIGNYQNAFKFQKQALQIAEDIEHKHQQVLIYNTLGLIYWTLNDSRRALENLDQSRQLAVELQAYLDVASAYNNMGLVYRKDKEYEKSIELFDEALKRDVKLKSKWGQGYTHRNLGMSYLRLKKLEEAENHIHQAIQLSSEIKNNTNLVKAKLELGHLALERDQCDQAIGVFQETAGLAAQYNIKEVLWRALRGEGACLEKLGQRPEAIAAYQKAVDVVDSMRASIKVEEFQNGFLTDKQDVYKELILLLLESGKIRESFEFAERAKARSFIDLLGNQKISLKDDVSQKLYDRLTEQKQVIRETEEALAKTEGEEEVAAMQKKLIQARTSYQDLLIEVKQESPQISNFVTVDAITLDRLQKLLEPEMALVEYLVTKKELVAWVILPDRIEVKRTPVTEEALKDLIKDYRNRMQQLAPLDDQSRKLYDLVIRPIESLLKTRRVVGIIPHSQLHYLSFASLNDGQAYLIERHPLFFSPSASVLEYTFARKAKHEGPVKVLALGNPDLGTFNYDLPLAELEANAIRWDFPEVTVLTRDKAKESWLQEHISEYQVIHIASHGEFDPVNPLFSSLKLTRDSEADGNFEVNEVFSLDIQADLVTLSACQTGLGDITGGDELVGLNRAFIYAGTHAIVSSLWRVSDISTAVLIKHFYRNYSTENKGESLRKAQLQVRRLYPHPSYWAGFVLTGDYR